jgi:tetratricopeptide (TPR) repeat protein
LTELRVEDYVIPAADLGEENPLPQFQSALTDKKIKVDASLTEEDRRLMGWKTAKRVLPYRLQDGFNRDKKPRAFRAMVLENEFLKATVLPEIGGRLVSLVHKPSGRELLERNPVFQPANLGLRNAWFSGGIEWNTSQPGHYYHTCSPVFAARVMGTSSEPALRLYEWDRVKCFPYQIDLILPPGSPLLYARIRIVNPHNRVVPMYWWTNIAVVEREDVRVLAPADSAIHGSPTHGMGASEIPFIKGVDVSYATNHPGANEMFFRIPEAARPWEAALDGEGKGIFETSTSRLRGRKMFVWGMGRGGRWWQSFLAEPGHSYIEIQAGLARTQLECLPMPKLAEWTWTEAFGLLEADPKRIHSKDWRDAWTTAEAAVESMLPRTELDARHEEFDAVTRRMPDEVLSVGSGWGALERLRVARQKKADRVPVELVFDESTLGSEQEPWVRLLEDGALPEPRDGADPMQGMVQPEWRRLIQKGLSQGRGNHWLSWLHLGNMLFEWRKTVQAREAWERSAALKPTSWALRNLALAEMRRKHVDRAIDLMQRAWDAGPHSKALAMEYAKLLGETGRFAELRVFAESLPEDLRDNERIVIMSARAAVKMNDFDWLEEFFKRDFTTIREGEITLTELWFAYQARKIAAEEGIARSKELYERVRRECPPPANIDFRMH